ncbi:glycosyltransferase [Streptococcus infantarius]|nr:glycosyltransferase [Streptococcus infantarius]
MSEKSLLSVIVPVYNNENTIEDCIRSIIDQTYPYTEIIIINDGSTDNSFEILKYLSNQYENITLINSVNKGVSCARNLGLERASGKYVAFVDGDDLLEPKMYETLIKIYNNNPTMAFISCGFDNKEHISNDVVPEYQAVQNNFDKLFLNNKIQGFVWNKVYKYDFVKDLRFPTDIFAHEDLLFNYYLLNKHSDFLFVNLDFYHYRINTTGAMFSKHFSVKKLTALNVYEYILEDMKNNNSPYQKIVESHYVLVCLIIISNILSDEQFDENKEILNKLYSNISLYGKSFEEVNHPLKYLIAYRILKLNRTMFEGLLHLMNLFRN